MIYIRDNGGSYSDHGVDFIEVPDDLDRSQVETALLYHDGSSYRDKPYIVAVCERVEWRADEGCDFFRWFGPWDFTEWNETRYDDTEDPMCVIEDTEHGKRTVRLAPVASKLSLPFVRLCLVEWRKRAANDPRASWRPEMFDTIEKLIALGVKNAVWRE